MSMDALSAHLDRGWDLLRKNDFAGARISAQAAKKLDPESPEALCLLGAVAAGEGAEDEALKLYRQAMKIDGEYVAPMLYAAEILLWPREEYDEALHLIDRALDMAEEEEDYLDALLLKAEALASMGEDADAKAVLGELPPVDFPEAGFHLRAARSYLDLELTDEAEAHYQKALKLEESADAYHGLGMVYEARDDVRPMVRCWLKVRELDLEEEPVPWTLSQEEFERVAEEALGELPDRIRTLLQNVPIVASDYPSIEIIAEGNDPRMMGFFSGVPYPEKSNVGSVPHLDCVFLYQKNIERMVKTREEAAREIRITLLHETGHFFGLSEEELEEMGLG
ncbi:MAG TPA: metallopeptidase family protein [Haliangiales bacterium]|nr:metallopeptidase family protein [Haliangiales bacterium]